MDPIGLKQSTDQAIHEGLPQLTDALAKLEGSIERDFATAAKALADAAAAMQQIAGSIERAVDSLSQSAADIVSQSLALARRFDGATVETKLRLGAEVPLGDPEVR